MNMMRRMDPRIGHLADANDLLAKRVKMMEGRESSSPDGEVKGWKWHKGSWWMDVGHQSNSRQRRRMRRLARQEMGRGALEADKDDREMDWRD